MPNIHHIWQWGKMSWHIYWFHHQVVTSSMALFVNNISSTPKSPRPWGLFHSFLNLCKCYCNKYNASHKSVNFSFFDFTKSQDHRFNQFICIAKIYWGEWSCNHFKKAKQKYQQLDGVVCFFWNLSVVHFVLAMSPWHSWWIQNYSPGIFNLKDKYYSQTSTEIFAMIMELDQIMIDSLGHTLTCIHYTYVYSVKENFYLGLATTQKPRKYSANGIILDMNMAMIK